MNHRQRTDNILHYREVDRLPVVHFGYWPELLLEWAEQGHIPIELARAWGDGNDADRAIDARIGWDFNWFSVRGGEMGLRPYFAPEVIEVLPDGQQRVKNGHGVIERVRPGVASIPSEDDYTLKDRRAFEELYLPRMQYCVERARLDFFRRFNELRDAELPVGLSLGSLMGDIRNMTSVLGMSYLLYDEDETLFSDIVDAYAEMQTRVVEDILKTGARFDFGHYWEDICFKNGPLLSPVKFRALCAGHYAKRNALCHAAGIDIISLDCDGVVDQLLPVWMETGVNTMFPIEVGTWGDQFAPARARYGKELRGVGGMDKTVLRRDRAAVDAEIERLRPLIALGGYIPCPDHRLMPGTKFELVQYYVDRIRSLRV